jgi:hypothetical protein
LRVVVYTSCEWSWYHRFFSLGVFKASRSVPVELVHFPLTEHHLIRSSLPKPTTLRIRSSTDMSEFDRSLSDNSYTRALCSSELILISLSTLFTFVRPELFKASQYCRSTFLGSCDCTSKRTGNRWGCGK